MTCLTVLFQSELEDLAHLKGRFDPQRHKHLLSLLGGGYTNRNARQTHAEDLLAEYIAICPGTFAFHTGCVPSVEQLRKALLILFFDPEHRSILDRHEEIIANVFEREIIFPNGQTERMLGWSRETFKRRQLRLLLKHLARHLVSVYQERFPFSENEVLAQLDFTPGGEDGDEAA